MFKYYISMFWGDISQIADFIDTGWWISPKISDTADTEKVGKLRKNQEKL